MKELLDTLAATGGVTAVIACVILCRRYSRGWTPGNVALMLVYAMAFIVWMACSVGSACLEGRGLIRCAHLLLGCGAGLAAGWLTIASKTRKSWFDGPRLRLRFCEFAWARGTGVECVLRPLDACVTLAFWRLRCQLYLPYRLAWALCEKQPQDFHRQHSSQTGISRLDPGWYQLYWRGQLKRTVLAPWGWRHREEFAHRLCHLNVPYEVAGARYRAYLTGVTSQIYGIRWLPFIRKHALWECKAVTDHHRQPVTLHGRSRRDLVSKFRKLLESIPPDARPCE